METYAIASFLNDQIAAAVVRHDKWYSMDNGQAMPFPRTRYVVSDNTGEESWVCCPLGLYLILNANAERNLDPSLPDPDYDEMDVPGTGDDFATLLLGEDDEGSEFDLVASAAHEFMIDWDRGVIGVDDLAAAWGVTTA